MGGVGRVDCQGFLVREACVVVLVGGAEFFSLECNEVSCSEFWGVYGFYSNSFLHSKFSKAF